MGSSMSIRVVSAIPGRMRLQFKRVPGYKTQIIKCMDRLAEIDGVVECRHIHDAASVVVHYTACADAKLTRRHIASLITRTVGARPPRSVSVASTGDTEIERVRDISVDAPQGLNPLVMPSVALVVSISGLSPVCNSRGKPGVDEPSTA
jgi:hypothetical protein